MSVTAKLAGWVEKKPMILIRFDKEYSERLHNSRRGSEHTTLAKPHSSLYNFKLPTLCLLETQQHDATQCYLSTATKKSAVSTFESRLTIKKLCFLKQASFQDIKTQITDLRMKRLLRKQLPGEEGISSLSPGLSSYVVETLAGDTENQSALDTAFSLLLGTPRIFNNNWAQEDAIELAMAAFDIPVYQEPEYVVLKRGASSGLGRREVHLFEDNVVDADASRLPGFNAIAPDVTGHAVFLKGDELLSIYTANRLPLEEMLGVDLIYINETRGNIIMVQYKMLEEAKQKSGKQDWLFRPDKKSKEQFARMRLPILRYPVNDYRLNCNPFFFKFVKRKIVNGSPQSFFISRAHLSQLLDSPKAKGPRGGVRLSYEALGGTYLRKKDMLGLLRSGYVGTHRAETAALKVIIEQAAKGNKAIVLGWQQKMKQ